MMKRSKMRNKISHAKEYSAKKIKQGKDFAYKNRRIILSVGTVIGVVTTAVESYKSAKKVQKVKETLPKDAPTKTKVIAYSKAVAPAVITGTTTILGIGANHICASTEIKELTDSVSSLTAAYNLSKSLNDELTERVTSSNLLKSPDEKIEKVIQDVHREDLSVHTTGSGNTLMYDEWSKRYFRSDILTVQRKILDLKERYLRMGYMNMDEIYEAMGLPSNAAALDYGFDLNDGQSFEVNLEVQKNNLEGEAVFLNGEPAIIFRCWPKLNPSFPRI